MSKMKNLAGGIFIVFVVLIGCFFAGQCSPAAKNKNVPSLFLIEKKGKIGFINKKGEIKVSPQFDQTGDFLEGLCQIIIDRKYGFIDEDGKIVINPQFEKAGNFNEGLAFIRIGDKFGFIDRRGKIIINPQFENVSDFAEGLAVVTIGNKMGYIDKEGKIVINPQFDQANNFSENLATVLIGSNYGYINKEGKIVINPQFDHASDFSEGLAAVKSGKYWGYIDEKGKYVINPQFENVANIMEGLALVSVGNVLGYINKSGQFAINPQFDNAMGFSEGLAPVKIGNQWGYINKKGKIAINPQFTSVKQFAGGLALVALDDTNAYITRDGKFVWDTREPEISIKQSDNFLRNGDNIFIETDGIGKNADTIFTIENIGEKELKLIGSPLVSIGGINADQFTILQQPSKFIAAKQTAVFTLRFSPTSQGEHIATILIQSTDPNNSTFNLLIEGKIVTENDKNEGARKEISSIATALAEYIIDNGTLPQQSGEINERSSFCVSLSPFYIKKLPIVDPWGHNYLVYCGREVEGKYGITGSTDKDFLIISYGKIGVIENWEYDSTNPEKGIGSGQNPNLINFNGKFIRK